MLCIRGTIDMALCLSVCLTVCLSVTSSARNGYPGTRFNTRYPGTRQIPGYPGITQYPCYLFHKVRDTLFLSDNLNTTARAVDALHPHHKAGIQGWVPFPGVAACASHEKAGGWVSFEVALR